MFVYETNRYLLRLKKLNARNTQKTRFLKVEKLKEEVSRVTRPYLSVVMDISIRLCKMHRHPSLSSTAFDLMTVRTGLLQFVVMHLTNIYIWLWRGKHEKSITAIDWLRAWIHGKQSSSQFSLQSVLQYIPYLNFKTRQTFKKIDFFNCIFLGYPSGIHCKKHRIVCEKVMKLPVCSSLQ